MLGFRLRGWEVGERFGNRRKWGEEGERNDRGKKNGKKSKSTYNRNAVLSLVVKRERLA